MEIGKWNGRKTKCLWLDRKEDNIETHKVGPFNFHLDDIGLNRNYCKMLGSSFVVLLLLERVQGNTNSYMYNIVLCVVVQ